MDKSKKPLVEFKGGNKKTLTLIIIIALILSSMRIVAFIFKEQNRQNEATAYRLCGMADRDAAIVYNLFDGYTDTLRALSVYIKSADDLTSADTIGFLKKMAEAFGFERLSIDFPNGKSYTTDGIELNTAYNEFIESIKSGQIFITDVTNSNIYETPMVCIQVPIYKDGYPIASLGYSLKREYLNNLLKTVLSEKNKYFYIIDGNGEYVAFDAGENSLFSADTNFFDSLDTFIFRKGFSKRLIEKAFTNAETGHTEYSVEGVDRYGYYSPVGINNWLMISVTSKNAIDADTNRFLTDAFTLAAQILLIFLVVAVFAYLDQRKAWETAELDGQCFRILAEHTSKAILEWDYNKKIMYYPNINASAVHPDDYDLYRKMFNDVMNGRAIENLRLRMRASDEAYKYYSISSVVIQDSKGRPYKSIGFLENIDLQIRKENYLYQKANTDHLTGFNNKEAAETLISEVLASPNDETTHALMCIDLDNFKAINDGFGHLYGDEVLKGIAASIKSLFRSSDILGRFGGDEFVVFVRDIPSIDFVKEKADELNKCLHKTYRQGNEECTVSASIGIAVFPTNGNTYETIYKKADDASYTVKNSGKNSYSFATVLE